MQRTNVTSTPSTIDIAKLFIARNDIVTYREYKTRALAFLDAPAASAYINHAAISKDFFNKLDRTDRNVSPDEKLILACAFITAIFDVEAGFDGIAIGGISIGPLKKLIPDFIDCALDLKEQLGIACFSNVLLIKANLMQYVQVIPDLIELQDEIDTHAIFWKKETTSCKLQQTPKMLTITELISVLDTCRSQYLLKKFPEKNLDEVMLAFKSVGEFALSDEELAVLKNDYQEIQRQAKPNLSLFELTEMAKQVGNQLILSPSDRHNRLKLLAVIREVVKHTREIYPHNTQMLVVLAMLQFPQRCKGRIAQVRTGEGKSTIISMLATYLACQNKCVDIITSSRELAKRDQEEFTNFFGLFGITSSHIGYKQLRKEHFNGQILYGTNSDFEFSILFDALHDTNLRYTVMDGELKKRPCEVAIVDEVDNLFIDTARSSARLAIESEEVTNWVYEPILNYVKASIINATQTDAVSVKKILMEYRGGKYAEQANALTSDRILTWLSSAIESLRLELDKHYILEANYEGDDVDQLQVVIVDAENTGSFNEGCRWSQGKHEFVEVHNNIAPRNETRTAASLSHPVYFGLHKTIYGFSGTMGERAERQEVEKIYHVDTCDVPPHYPSLRKRIPGKIAETESDWSTLMIETIQIAHRQGQPILVLLESIKKTNQFSQCLKQLNVDHQLLNGKQVVSQEAVLAAAGRLGAITIATNLAGRGTDIRLWEESKKAQGLFVIFGFYPENSRVEDQGLGRAARQGQPGCGTLIIHAEEVLVKRLLPEGVNSKLSFDEIFRLLDQRRSQQVALLSMTRIQSAKNDALLDEVQTAFFEMLAFCRQTLSDTSITEKVISDLKTFPHANTHQLIVDLRKSFIQKIKQTWSIFFTDLQNKQSHDARELFKEFYHFYAENMEAALANPLKGFTDYIKQQLQEKYQCDVVLDSLVCQEIPIVTTHWENKILMREIDDRLKVAVFFNGDYSLFRKATSKAPAPVFEDRSILKP